MITLTDGQEDNVLLPSYETEFDISFTSAMAWKISVEYPDGQSDWLSLSQKMGNGSATPVKVKSHAFANNSEWKRSANIIISSGPLTMNIYVIQKSKYEDEEDTELVFELTDNRAEVSADGGRIKVTVRYNVEYECSEDADWIREVKTRSVEEKTHTFDIEPNDSDMPRTAVITFCGSSMCVPFTVEQEAYESPSDGPSDNPGEDPDNPGDNMQEPVFELLDFSTELPSEGGSFAVRLNSNVTHDYQIDESWIQESSRSVSGTITTYNFNVSVNTGEERSAVIRFCANDRCLPFVVKQSALHASSELYVDKTSITVGYSGTTDPIVVNVTSNTSWEAYVNSSWCQVYPSEGMNDGLFQIVASANDSYQQRTANIYVSTPDASIVRSLIVTQDPLPAPEEDASWSNMEFYHRSLVMRFTADWCGYCPMMASAIELAKADLPDKIEAISVHSGGSSLHNDYSSALEHNYPVSGLPFGLVDCITGVQNQSAITSTKSNILNAVMNTESLYETLTTATWTSSVSDGLLTVDLSAYFKMYGNYKITVLLLQDNIVGYQADYNSGSSNSYVHSDVLVGALTSVLGESVYVTRDNFTTNCNYTIVLPSDYDSEDFRILVYIQREKDGTYYVDNAASEKVGHIHMLEIVEDGVRGEVEGIVPGDDIIL